MKVTWASGRDGSIEIMIDGQPTLAFATLAELDEFDDALVEARNEIAQAIEEQGSDEQQGPSRS